MNDKDKQYLLEFMKKKLNLKLLILFGSQAKNEAFIWSDIDIAFLSKEDISNINRWELSQELAYFYQKEVDLIDLKKANTILKFEIVSTGEVIFNKNQDNFLIRAYTEYFDFNIDRRDIILNKIETIKRCLKRVNEEYVEEEFTLNYTKQDSVILNLERASQATIDIATNIIRIKKLSSLKISREVFAILEQNSFISKKSSQSMQKMVGFRNIAVHDYQSLNIDIVVNIIKNHLIDFEIFIEEIKNLDKN